MIRQWSYSLSMFAWLTIGYAAVHIVIAFWGISIFHGLFPQSNTYEHLQITADGEPLIASWGSGQQDLRKLDGTPVADFIGVQQKLLGATYSTTSNDTDHIIWADRILGVNDYRRPSTFWYFIAPPDKSGKAYFTVYDELTRQLIGYFDPNGYTKTLPSIENRFPVNIFKSWNHAFPGAVSACQQLNYFERSREPHQANRYVQQFANAEPDSLWILSQGTIYEIRLGLRKIRTLIENRPDFQTLNQHQLVRDHKTYLQLVVRTDAGVLVIDPQSNESESIPLDPIPPETSESLYQLQTGQKILVLHGAVSHKDRLQKNTIIWMSPQGQIERRTEVDLAGYTNELFENQIEPVLCAPLPLISFGTWLIGPIVAPKEFGDSQTYSGLLQEVFPKFRIWIVVTTLIGIGAGWACRRREHDVFGRSGWFWPILVGLCGWFGWMGYICFHPLPARLPDGHWLPSHPEPVRPLGTEIFA